MTNLLNDELETSVVFYNFDDTDDSEDIKGFGTLKIEYKKV